MDFRYPGAKEDVLSDIDFVAEPGKTTAIIGSTGCGKSTLVNLIPRFYDVTGGSIELDGHDIRDYTLSELRESIGFVPQKGILFSGTIASNLRFGKADASDEQIKKAADIAQASEFIETKNDRYESSIAQGGSNVSGGQKQRLAIARAIAKDPHIYVFDDSFSALDMKTDARLRAALAEVTENASVIIVAQRISTIIHADQILVLDDGKIVGKGTHEELLKMPPKRPRGPMGRGPGMVTEKARDFKGSTKKLIKYLGRYWAAIIAVMIFAAVSTVFSVAGPKVMGKATTALADGLMNKIAGTGGIDFDYIAKGLKENFYMDNMEDPDVLSQKVLSYALYPKVYEDYCRHFEAYNDVTGLESHVYFYGLRKGEETTLRLDEGKDLIIKFIDMTEPDKDGYRLLDFEVNGSIREIKVLDKNLEVKTDGRVKADKSNPAHLGSTIPGTVGKVLVNEGDEVTVNMPLMTVEAMKMETTVVSTVNGKVDKIYVKEGEQVNQEDLLISFEIDE